MLEGNLEIDWLPDFSVALEISVLIHSQQHHSVALKFHIVLF